MLRNTTGEAVNETIAARIASMLKLSGLVESAVVIAKGGLTNERMVKTLHWKMDVFFIGFGTSILLLLIKWESRYTLMLPMDQLLKWSAPAALLGYGCVGWVFYLLSQQIQACVVHNWLMELSLYRMMVVCLFVATAVSTVIFAAALFDTPGGDVDAWKYHVFWTDFMTQAGTTLWLVAMMFLWRPRAGGFLPDHHKAIGDDLPECAELESAGMYNVEATKDANLIGQLRPDMIGVPSTSPQE